ncbi:MAG: peptidylprolyl isomerase [Thioalkalivibrionaceae bacterium]
MKGLARAPQAIGLIAGAIFALHGTVWAQSPATGSLPPASNGVTTETSPAADIAPIEGLTDRIVAVVGTDVITERELVDRMNLTANQLRLEDQSVPDTTTLARNVLDEMIDLRIQLNEARRVGIAIDDATLNRTLERIAADNGLDLFSFRDALASEGIDFAAFRRQIRDEMTITQLRNRQIDERIRISEAEIEDLIATEARSIDQDTRYRLDEIFFPVTRDATSAELRRAREDAEAAARRLRAGETFADVATSAPRSLPDDWIPASTLPSALARTVILLDKGRISDIVRSERGFHIIRVADRAGASASVEQIRARHVLIAPNELVSISEAQTRAQDILRRVRAGEDFAQLAGSFSDDPGSATRGGELGWLAPGDTVPEFEQAIARMSPGDPAVLIRSEFGFHVIEVSERREIDDTRNRLREQAVQILRERKRADEADLWLDQLRSESFVDIRVPALAP